MLFPYYHTVSDVRLAHISNIYPIKSVKQFENDLEYLCKYYYPVSAETVYNIIRYQKKPEKPCFHLTFDDGLKEIYTVIAPILEKKGIPATFFINTGFINNKALFYRYKVSLVIEELNANPQLIKNISATTGIKSTNLSIIKKQLLSLTYNQSKLIDEIASALNIDFESYLCKHAPYLNEDEIKTLKSKGFQIASHSVDHPNFKDISIDEQKDRIENAFVFLQEKFNIKNHCCPIKKIKRREIIKSPYLFF